MKTSQIMFFSTSSDIEPILELLESEFSIHYFQMGMFDDKQIPFFSTIFDIPDFGFTDSGDWNRDRRLMILPKENSLVIRDVPQRKGGIKYASDTTANPVGVTLQIGGIFKSGILVAGKMGSSQEVLFTKELYKAFSKQVKKKFNKIGAFYVGHAAEDLLRSGWRLVTNDGSPKEYDLALT